MKTQLLILVFLLCAQVIHAQPQPTIVQENQFGGGQYDNLKKWAIENFTTGEITAVGKSNSHDGDLPANSGLLYNGWLAKWATDNLILGISSPFGGDDDDEFADVITTEFGPVFLLGKTRSASVPNYHGGDDLWVVKNLDGSISVEKAFGGTGNEAPFINRRYGQSAFSTFTTGASGSMTADGDWAGATTYGGSDIGFLKIDTNLNVLDKKIFGTPGTDLAFAAFENNNGFTVAALTTGTGGSFTTPIIGGSDALVFKMGTDFSLQEEYRYGGDKADEVYTILSDESDGFFAAGATWSVQWDFFNDGNADVRDISCSVSDLYHSNGIVFRADASGNIIWSQCFAGSADDRVEAIYYQHPDILYVLGSTASNDYDFDGLSHGGWDCFIAALDANTGEKKWMKVFGGSGTELAHDIIRLDGGNLLTLNESQFSSGGDIGSTNHGFSDTWIVEFTNPTGIDEPFAISEVLAYPNPANESVTIDLPSNARILQIEITNLKGQVISAIHPVQSSITLDVKDYPDGFYFVRINQEGSQYFSKMVVAH